MTTAVTPATSADRAAPDDAQRFLRLLAGPGDVFELRAVSKRRKTQHTGLVRGHDDGIYVTINPVHDGLLARYAANQVHEALLGTSSDKELLERRLRAAADRARQWIHHSAPIAPDAPAADTPSAHALQLIEGRIIRRVVVRGGAL